jgi:hypothetical protein
MIPDQKALKAFSRYHGQPATAAHSKRHGKSPLKPQRAARPGVEESAAAVDMTANGGHPADGVNRHPN